MKDLNYKSNPDGMSYNECRNYSWYNLHGCPDVSKANNPKELVDIMTSQEWAGIKPSCFRYLQNRWWDEWKLFDFTVEDVFKECESRDYWIDNLVFIYDMKHTLLSKTRLRVNKEEILWVGSDDCWFTWEDFEEVSRKIKNEFDWIAKDLYLVSENKFFIPVKDEWIESVKKKPELYLKPNRFKDDNPNLDKRIKSLIKLNKDKK